MQISDVDSLALIFPKERNLFSRILVISLCLHIAVAMILLQRGNGIRHLTATYIDLNMVSPATPATEAHKSAIQPPEPEIPVSEPEEPSVRAQREPSPFENLQNQVQQAVQNRETEGNGSLDKLSFSLGMTDGYFGMLAEGRTLRPDIREYYLSLLQRVNEMWWTRKNRQEQLPTGAIINILIARDGTVIHLELMRGSGNAERDKEMLQMLGTAGSLPPLPSTYQDDFFKAPIRFVAPLGLMAPPSPHAVESQTKSS